MTRGRTTPVHLVAVDPSHPPLALGMVLASAARAPNADHRVLPELHKNARTLLRAIAEEGEGVVLFSNYIWSVRPNLAISAEIKTRYPGCITVHGGPDVPKDPQASTAFMTKHAHVDVAVDGEGEKTFSELLAASRSSFDAVDGVVFRDAVRGIVKTRPRARVFDLDSLPSPYLDGFFDHHAHSRWRAAILETNRGCPYGCTFCDWGSATLQKIRSFGLDRIEAEIEWIARRKIAIVFVADANFGILPRDVVIAEKLARAKSRFGFPQQIVVNYAKNATDRVAEIIRIFVRAQMTAHGIISLQTTDPTVLEAVDRKNIKTARYEDLIGVFRRERLPLSTDLMLGMPEQTVGSIKRDLQFAFDWALTVQFSQTQMLVNSPMAERGYVERHRLAIDQRGYVTSTRTMTEAEAERGRRLCYAFQVFVETGMLRYVLYALEEEHDLAALDVIEALYDAVTAGDESLRTLRAMFDTFYSFGPLGLGQLRYRSSTLWTRWDRVYAELDAWVFARYRARVPKAILDAQRALMPRFGAIHPRTIELEHDVVAYFRDLGIGDRRYLDPARPRKKLASYPPGVLEISDTEGTCWSIPEVRMTYDSHHVPFELHSALRLESVRARFLKKREVFALKLERSRLGLAFTKARRFAEGLR